MTIDRQIECLKREVKRRQKFYPYLIENGKLTQDEADLEITLMQKAMETLTQLKGLVSK
jgi:hypothetical protein